MQNLKSELHIKLYRQIASIAVFLLLLFPGRILAAPVVIGNVPAYNWYHGCGPTAAASILGYWDLKGYGNLFPEVSGWNEVKLTSNVEEYISSTAHNQKYDPKPDNPGLPEPQDISIADFFHTSEDIDGFNLDWGESLQKYADNAFNDYANYRGYEFYSSYKSFMMFSWNDLITEINAGRPMMFLVDIDGDTMTDHFVPVLGYDKNENGSFYGFYDTWGEAEDIVWKPFQLKDGGATWGIGYATFVQPMQSPIPASGLLLFYSGLLIGLVRVGKKKFFK